ncbi:phosphatidic acid phosphatase type 2/haloperoxidase [Chaetomidium leptoderma]|uniref:Phosphatidic acid phosphatase type 2/haloperoxidase n=1 Tax=Chaetomidium leptoderma TaxID=669021 RepID=A0AAN7A037_9PEZI|nr:phosphatidic acid phosphatase type 2/haloperoxidase [Chaetomidium leptoderma]
MAPPRANSGTSPRGGILASFSRFWQASCFRRTYASDYIGFVFLLTGYILIQFFVEPFHRMFSLHDLRISFPHAEVERVPLSHAFIYALFIPLFLLTATNLATHATRHKHHVTLLGLVIAMILTSFLTDVIKNTVGRPRPDLLARCLPSSPTSPGGGDENNKLVTIDVCTQTHHHTLHDGWRSFPSGHSSFAFAGLGYLSLFLAGQTRIFAHSSSTSSVGEHTEKVVRGDLVRALVCGAPLLGATMIAISRCQDYRHDVWDVCVGGLLGYTVTYWSYRRYWPRLGSGRCDEPYAGPPGAGQEEGLGGRAGYGRVRDEEEGVGAGRSVGIELGQFGRT